MKWILITLLVLHGAIHLMGAAKGFQWADISELKTPVSRVSAQFWLSTTFLFFSTAFLLIRSSSIWWIPAALAIILSSFLIFTSWEDARWGMIPNVILLLVTIVGFAQWQFDRQVIRAEHSLLTAPLPEHQLPTQDTLPPIFQQWLERSALPQKRLHWVRLKQEGTMRTSPSGKWMPFTAKQLITPQNPGFVWSTQASIFPGMFFLGRDQYRQGKGQMLIRLWGLIPVVNASGSEIDQGALLRYLSELVWLPSGILHPAITCTEIDSYTGSATMTWGDVSASGTYRFSSDGDFLSFTALRYYHRPEGPTLEKWQIEADPASYQIFQGVRIPTQFKVIWKLKEGDFHWLNINITDVEYGFDGKNS